MNLYIVALTEDIKRHLRDVNEAIKAGATLADINRQIADYIQYHADSKQLMENVACSSPRTSLFTFWNSFSFICSIMDYFVGFLQPMFIVVFLWSTITICGVMLMIQIEIV